LRPVVPSALRASEDFRGPGSESRLGRPIQVQVAAEGLQNY
jgi:hypothetical protein